MGVNQVKFGDATVMDISDSTVAPETLLSGVTAYNKAGNKIVGEVVVEHVEVEPVLETGTKSATITVGEESTDIYCENTKAEVKNMKTAQSATITNGIAQFECIDKNFVKALKLTMEPIQDLHGYDHPWAGGAGKNIINITDRDVTVAGVNIKVENGVITLDGTSTGPINYHLIDNMSFPEDTYIFNIQETIQNGLIAVQTSDGNKIAYVAGNQFTASMSGFMWFNCGTGKTFSNVVVKPMIRLSTETDAAFAPYSNICPISGRTEASVTRTGKNQLDATNSAISGVNIWYYGNSTTYKFWKAGTYTFSYEGNSAITYYTLQGGSNTTILTTLVDGRYKGNFTLKKDGYYRFFTQKSPSISADDVKKPMITLSTADQTYTAYQAETHTHQFGQTVYGGEDDFVNGGAISDMAIIDLGSLNWAYYEGTPNRFQAVISGIKLGGKGLCSSYKRTETRNVDKAFYMTNSYYGYSIIAFYDSDYSSASDFKASVSGQTLCYELATPTAIKTTAEKITTLPGVNIISATEPISECSYRVLEENLSDTIYSNETLVGEDSDVYTFRTAPDISDANYVEENIVGGSVAFNQLIQNGNFVNTDNWSGLRGTLSAANGILTFTYTDVSDRNVVYQTIPKIKSGHKYFMSCEYRPKYNHSVQMGVELNGGSYITKTFSTIGSMWKKLTGIINGDANEQTTFSIIVRPSGGSYAANDTDQIENVIFVDLTHMFGSSVADYIYNLENTTAGTGLAFLQKYGFFTKDYYDYNAGSLQSVNFNKWFKTSKNLFNPNRLNHIPNYDNIIDGNDVYIGMEKYSFARLHDIGSYIPGNGRTYTLQFDPPSDITWTYASVRCRLKDNSDFGKVGLISGWTYDDATKSYIQSFENASHVEVTATIPDCLYCEFGIGYDDSRGDIKETGTYVKFSNIQLEVGSEATDYEPYEGYEISLDDDLDLRGLFKISDNKLVADGDIYEGDGKITRKYGVIDLGTLTWLSEDSSFLGVARVNSIQIEPLGIKWTSIPLCSLYEGVLHKGYNAFEYGEIGLSNAESAPQLRCRSEAFIGKTNEEIKAMMSGVILLYELAEPILNGETGFDSPQVFIPNGNEYFVKTYASTPDRDFDVPAGHVGKYYGKSMFKEISLPTIPKSGGTYTLKCNVLADGNKKLYWRADNN